jgi:lactate permease
MFDQLITPVSDSLLFSFLVAAVPIAVVLVLLGIVRLAAWQASACGLIVALTIAIAVWQMPGGLAFNSVANGAVFAVWPVMWIVFNALLLYNVAVVSGRFDTFRDWVTGHLPNDRRIVLVVIGFCFGALLEGISGFGTPVAITSSLLVLVGFPAVEAVVFTLIFNTAPVAFGALGIPITTLGAVTQMPATVLGAMVGRQLPFLAVLLPFYVMAIYGGTRSVKALWPLLLVAGASFGLTQFVVSNYIDYQLTDVLSSLGSLAVTLLFLLIWKPAPDPEFAVRDNPGTRHEPVSWAGWLPWVVVSIVVIAWTDLAIAPILQQKIEWPGLHNVINRTLYATPDKPSLYAAVWVFQPLGTGTAILVSAILTALLVGVGVDRFVECIGKTWVQIRIAVLTVVLIISLAYLMNYSGLNYTLGKGVASAGVFFPLLSPFLGWVAVALSGSDTSGNALFGNLQVVAARQLELSPVLIAATNSSGGVMGKMISPQNIATGVSTVGMQGQEGAVFARTFIHSIVLTLLLGVLVFLQQYVLHFMIPG